MTVTRSIADVLANEQRLAEAVRRVRDWYAEESYSDPGDDPYCLGYNDAIRDVLKALDGDE